MTIAEQVKYVRIKLQLTQLELSKETSISVITIARWEAGTQIPRAKLLGKFLAYCELKGITF